MKKTSRYLVGLVGTATLLLALSGSAQAHPRFFFRAAVFPPFPPPVIVAPVPPVYVAPAPPAYYYDRGAYYMRRYDPYSGRYYLVPRYDRPYYRHHYRYYGTDGY